jgi:hypothetical protein
VSSPVDIQGPKIVMSHCSSVNVPRTPHSYDEKFHFQFKIVDASEKDSIKHTENDFKQFKLTHQWGEQNFSNNFYAIKRTTLLDPSAKILNGNGGTLTIKLHMHQEHKTTIRVAIESLIIPLKTA